MQTTGTNVHTNCEKNVNVMEVNDHILNLHKKCIQKNTTIHVSGIVGLICEKDVSILEIWDRETVVSSMKPMPAFEVLISCI